MKMVAAMQAIYLSTRAQVRGKGMSAGHGWGDFAQAFYCRGHDGFCSVQLSISPKFPGVSSHALDRNEGAVQTRVDSGLLLVDSGFAGSRQHTHSAADPPFGPSEGESDWIGARSEGHFRVSGKPRQTVGSGHPSLLSHAPPRNHRDAPWSCQALGTQNPRTFCP